MKARACARIAAGGVLAEVVSQPPLTLRRLHDPDRDVCALALVGSAAGPLDGDDLALAITLGPRARGRLLGVGATLALGSGGQSACLATRIVADEQVRFAGRPGPLIVSAAGRLTVDVQIRLAASAALEWTEVVVLGRTGETAGAVRLNWDVERAGRPLLRQVTDLTDPALRDWPGTIAGARVVATRLRVGPDVVAVTRAPTRMAATHALATDAELTTVLAPDALTAARTLAALAD
jgi:urease accessory protein